MEEHVLHATFTSRVSRLPVCLIRISGKMQSIKGGACPSRLCICGVLQCVAVCCSASANVAACCSALQCVAVCCSVLQCVAVSSAVDITTYCNILQHTSTHCNTLPRYTQSFSAQHFTDKFTYSEIVPTNYRQIDLLAQVLFGDNCRVAKTHRMPYVAGNFPKKSD